MMTNDPTDGRFVLLDGIRGVAAILVMLLHCLPFPMLGYLAVDLFFLLSGFVLARGYGDSLSDPGQRRRFAISRVIRIEPLWLVSLAIAMLPTAGMVLFGWGYWTPGVWLLAVVSAPFFILLPYDGWGIPLNQPGWSLAYELLANVVLLVIGARRWPVWAVVLIAGPLLLLGIKQWTGADDTGWMTMTGNIPRVLFSFFLGVILYRLWRGGRVPRFGAPAWLLLLAPAPLYFYAGPHLKAYLALVIFVIHPLMIWLGASARPTGGVARLASWLGFISYGVYVLHAPVIMLVEGLRFLLWNNNAQGYRPDLWTAGLVVPITLVLAHWLTVRVEMPLQRWLKARFLPRKAG